MSMTQAQRERVERALPQMKRDILALCHSAGKGGAHLGGCLSMAEILAVLYLTCFRFDPEDLPHRDRFVLSKGHGGIALYAALKQAGILPPEELEKGVTGPGVITAKHPARNPRYGLEVSSGSLGLGLAFAVGQALSLGADGNGAMVYALVGDGELDEGSNWEAAAVAGHYGLSNLTVLVDQNGLQLSQTTRRVQRGDWAARFAAFGFTTAEADGHDIDSIHRALCLEADGPRALLFHTVKGHGVSFAQNAVDWHSNVLTDELYQTALQDLGLN